MFRFLTTTSHAPLNLLRKSLDTDPSSPIATWGHLILRASIGAMIFYIHGLHKLEGGLAYLQHGTPWTLAKEVAEMHFPAPVASAFAACARGSRLPRAAMLCSLIPAQRSRPQRVLWQL